jgi:hypothetical protein
MHVNSVRDHRRRCPHFITFSRDQRMTLLDSIAARDTAIFVQPKPTPN